MNARELKAQIKAGKPVFGMMLSSADSMRWDRMLASVPLDYVVIDSEHGSRDRLKISELVVMCRAAGIVSVVRVPAPDPTMVAIALDTGADGILTPYCEDIQEIKECAWKTKTHPVKGQAFKDIVETGKYPSDKAKAYLDDRRANNFFIVGVESITAANKLDEILGCGAPIDVVFVGPNDMTTSIGKPDELEDPEYIDILKNIIAKSEAKGIPVMIHHQNMKMSNMSLELGSRFILHGSDAGLLRQKVTEDFTALRSAAAKKWGGDAGTEVSDKMEAV